MGEAKVKVSPKVVERDLAGVNYPASRQNLIDQAKKNEADKDVMDTIANLPDQTYHSPIDISKAMAGEEVSPGTHAAGAGMAISAADVQRYLRGIDYPAGKEGVISQAQTNNAPNEVLDILRKIRDQEFHSAADLSRALGEVM